MQVGLASTNSLFLKHPPRPLIILLPITLVERRLVDDRALDGAARLGVVLDRLLDSATGLAFYLPPFLGAES
jgi:hypothetical protein